MGVMDKLLTMMKIGDEGEEEDYYDPEDDGYAESKPVAKDPEPERVVSIDKPRQTERKAPVKKRPFNMNDNSVCVFKPKSFEEGTEVCQALLDDKTVVLNFEEIKIDISQRVLDMVIGCCYAIGGHLQKISNYIFIATPASVDVSGDFQDSLTGNFDSL
ncbi:MAG: cell division protein SepF [Lachnospiraceae bacterium]|nr:cell division protein SepF [Lachnospiraceae bacterium]